MKALKFRAIIPERNATIYFDLNDIAELRQKFSIKEILVPWLLDGNVPDLYTSKKGKNDKEIYQGDIVIPAPNEWNEPPFTIEFVEGCFTLGRPRTMVRTIWEINFQLEVIGNITENPELLGEK